MNKSLKVLSIALLFGFSLRAEEAAAPEVAETKAVKVEEKSTLKEKIRSAVVSMLAEQSEISFTDDQLTKMVASFEQELAEKSVKEQDEWLQKLDTISLTLSKEKTA